MEEQKVPEHRVTWAEWLGPQPEPTPEMIEYGRSLEPMAAHYLAHPEELIPGPDIPESCDHPCPEFLAGESCDCVMRFRRACEAQGL